MLVFKSLPSKVAPSVFGFLMVVLVAWVAIEFLWGVANTELCSMETGEAVCQPWYRAIF